MVAHGINLGLHTRIYFDGQANANDPVLTSTNDRVRKSTLIAIRDGQSYNFDNQVQGENETVFLNV